MKPLPLPLLLLMAKNFHLYIIQIRFRHISGQTTFQTHSHYLRPSPNSWGLIPLLILFFQFDFVCTRTLHHSVHLSFRFRNIFEKIQNASLCYQEPSPDSIFSNSLHQPSCLKSIFIFFSSVCSGFASQICLSYLVCYCHSIAAAVGSAVVAAAEHAFDAVA